MSVYTEAFLRLLKREIRCACGRLLLKGIMTGEIQCPKCGKKRCFFEKKVDNESDKGQDAPQT